MTQQPNPSLIHEIGPRTYEIPIGFVPNMRVPGRFFATAEMTSYLIEELNDWIANPKSGLPSLIQIAYTATLPGISIASFGMPDMHSGYGFSIGGVAAFDTSDPSAIISPGGVGYDINCGVRCLASNLTIEQVEPLKKALVNALYKHIPVGVGGKKQNLVSQDDIPKILTEGAKWAVERGYGFPRDIERCEEGGHVSYSDASLVSEKARARGLAQLGTLGSGNHYIEIQKVDKIFDEAAAKAMGLFEGQITVMIHTGSRGLGHQVCSEFTQQTKNLENQVPDKQLSYALYNSDLGKRYLNAMGAAANYAWCNRQLVTHFVRRAFAEALRSDDVKLDLIYDVAHNIAKLEKHVIDGVEKEFIVHRKGATRSFAPNRSELPDVYKEIGQPVLVGGSMGTASYILVGTEQAMKTSFGSTCHGAGRQMSRSKATRKLTAEDVKSELATKGIELKATNNDTIVEEAPEAYKDIEEVISTCDVVGISKKVARLVPVGVIKG